MKRTLLQNSILHSLISQLGIDADTKSDLVDNYTNGRTTKSSEMTADECQRMIDDLSFQQRNDKAIQNEEKQKLRRTVFTIFFELNWINADMNSTDKTAVINEWLNRKTTFEADLNKLSVDNLNILIAQLRAIKRRTEESQKKKMIIIRAPIWRHNYYSYNLN